MAAIKLPWIQCKSNRWECWEYGCNRYKWLCTGIGAQIENITKEDEAGRIHAMSKVTTFFNGKSWLRIHFDFMKLSSKVNFLFSSFPSSILNLDGSNHSSASGIPMVCQVIFFLMVGRPTGWCQFPNLPWRGLLKVSLVIWLYLHYHRVPYRLTPILHVLNFCYFFEISSGLCRLGYLRISVMASLSIWEFISSCTYDVKMYLLLCLILLVGRQTLWGWWLSTSCSVYITSLHEGWS